MPASGRIYLCPFSKQYAENYFGKFRKTPVVTYAKNFSLVPNLLLPPKALVTFVTDHMRFTGHKISNPYTLYPRPYFYYFTKIRDRLSCMIFLRRHPETRVHPRGEGSLYP